MTGTPTSDADASKDVVVDTSTTTATNETASSLPPLVQAALRLEKILYDHNESINANESSSKSNNNKYESFYMNPIKVVRRWLGTSSGATSTTQPDGTKGTGITVEDIQNATKLLLNPTLECTQRGRTLLLSKDLLLLVGDGAKADGMDTEDVVTDDMDVADQATTTATTYVTIASAREVECWLFSLMIRTLWKHQAAAAIATASSSQQFLPALMTFANEALFISTGHLNHSSSSSTTPVSNPVKTSMYPFIARLYRFAALAYESYSSATTSTGSIANSNDMLSTMSKAHTLATVRRDVDTQATILNIMLRELLRHAQGTVSLYYKC